MSINKTQKGKTRLLLGINIYKYIAYTNVHGNTVVEHLQILPNKSARAILD